MPTRKWPDNDTLPWKMSSLLSPKAADTRSVPSQPAGPKRQTCLCDWWLVCAVILLISHQQFSTLNQAGLRCIPTFTSQSSGFLRNCCHKWAPTRRIRIPVFKLWRTARTPLQFVEEGLNFLGRRLKRESQHLNAATLKIESVVEGRILIWNPCSQNQNCPRFELLFVGETMSFETANNSGVAATIVKRTFLIRKCVNDFSNDFSFSLSSSECHFNDQFCLMSCSFPRFPL